MKISICIPVVGRFRWFSSALCSILAQEHEDWELVVYDGDPTGPVSGDNMVRGLLDLVGGRLSYELGPNLGLFPGFNRCLERSKAPIVYCMGSDDMLTPGALAGVSREFERERYPTVFWLYGKTVSAAESGHKTGLDGGPTTYASLLEQNCIGLPSVFASSGLLRGLEGGFDTRYRYAADYEAWLRLWRRREPMFLDQELGIYRHHDGQESRIHSERLEKEVVKVRERHRTMPGFITGSRNVYVAKKAYRGVEIPGSVN